MRRLKIERTVDAVGGFSSGLIAGPFPHRAGSLADGEAGSGLESDAESSTMDATEMRLERNLPYWLLVGASLTWVGLVFLAPWARSRGWAGADLLYALFDPVCHQMPWRSFWCFGHPLGACHRCTGLYMGFTLGLLTLPYLPKLRQFLLERSRLILLFFLPMFVDAMLLGINTYLSRFLTGLVAAFPVGLFVWAAASQLYRPNLSTVTEGTT